MVCKKCKGTGEKPNQGGMCDPCFGFGYMGGTHTHPPPPMTEEEAVEVIRSMDLNVEVSGSGEVRNPEPE